MSKKLAKIGSKQRTRGGMNVELKKRRKFKRDVRWDLMTHKATIYAVVKESKECYRDLLTRTIE